MLETTEDRDVKFEDQDWKDFAAESQTSIHRLSSMTLENDMPSRSAKFTYPKLLKFFGEEGKGEPTIRLSKTYEREYLYRRIIDVWN